MARASGPNSAGLTGISEAELDVLKVLWESGPATVRRVHELLGLAGHEWAYNTVLTLLSRLRDKGHVESRSQGQALEFRAVVSRELLLRSRLRELLDRVCDGAAAPLVAALVDGGPLGQEDLGHLRRLLDELEAQDSEKGGDRG